MENLVPLVYGLKFENIVIDEESISCSCPFAKWKHPKQTDSNPSFSIYMPEPGIYIYNCFTCKSKGTVQDLVFSLFERTGDRSYLTHLADIKYVKPNNEFFIKEKPTIVLNKEIYEDLCPPVEEYKVATDYCLSRGISINTINRLDLRYHPEHKRIMFKMYNYTGELVGFSGRSIRSDDNIKIRETANMPKKDIFLGIHKIVRDKPVILVEGLFSYARLHEFGFDSDYNILACLGSSLSKPKRDILIGLGLPVYVFFDNDTAGLIGMFGKNGLKGASAELVDHVRVYKLTYPTGIVDPDHLTKEQIIDMLDSAELMIKKVPKVKEEFKKNKVKTRTKAEDKYNLMFASE